MNWLRKKRNSLAIRCPWEKDKKELQMKSFKNVPKLGDGLFFKTVI